MKTRLRRTTALALIATLFVAGQAIGQEASSPSSTFGRQTEFVFQTDKAFSMSEIPAYAGDNQDVYAYIDTHHDQNVENLQHWVRQPSVSAENIGIAEMAELAAADFRKVGFQEVEIVPTEGHPGVWAYYNAGAEKTIVVYMMLDVQPVDPADWSVPPFDAAIVENELGRVMIGRGVQNTKGVQRAFLNTLEAIIATRGTLPVNLMVVAESEEEIGSIHYPDIIAKYADRLKTADAAINPGVGQRLDGSVDVKLGNKGILHFELTATGNPITGGPQTHEIHSQWRATTDSPTWRLVQALSTLTSPDGNTITVPGYYDTIRAPSLDEQELVNGMVEGWSRQEVVTRRTNGIDHWIGGMSGRTSLYHYLFDSSLNIQGITAGYQGAGSKTIVPHTATAKLDSRLAPDQQPDEALRLIRAHLDAEGFADIAIEHAEGYPASQTAVTEPVVRAVLANYNKYGIRADVSPRSGGSRPSYVFTQTLGLPYMSVGIGHGGRAHAPNEYLVIDPAPGSGILGLNGIERFYADVLFALGEGEK